MIDAMAHLEDPRVEDPRRLLERAYRCGITDVINASFSPERTLPPLERTVRVHRCTGLHPMAIAPACWRSQLDAVTDACPDHVAVGEIGLDARDGAPPLDLQREVFEHQLAIARIQEKPVIIHCVQAWGALLNCLESFWPLKGIIHGYGGSPELLARVAKIGLLPSFGGSVTHPRFKKAVASAVAAERFCIESDTPDHPPAGCEQSEPAELPRVVETLARLRNESERSVVDTSRDAALWVFGIGREPE